MKTMCDEFKKFIDGVKMYRKPRFTGVCIGDWCLVVKDDPDGRLKAGDRVVIVGDSRFANDEHGATYGVYTDPSSCGTMMWFNKDLFKVEHRFSEYRKATRPKVKST